MPSLYQIENDKLSLSFHAGQMRAWHSERRFIAVMAGTQSGKTSWGPFWLWREIRNRGQGDYLAVTSTYDLFKLKMLPALRELFEGTLKTGRYWSGDRIIELVDPETGQFLANRSDDPMWGRIILRSAESGGGLESTTAKGAWLDEAGQQSFSLEAWEAIQRRLLLNLGRALMTTTLYNFGWLKTKVYDAWKAGDQNYDVIQFDSTENPLFPIEEFARARQSMMPWKFNMQYRGLFERPAGMIYDSFDEALCKVPRFAIPDEWPRYLGLDFGGVNTAGVFYAEEPGSGRLFAYREYKAGGMTAAEHSRALKDGEPKIPFCVGGSHSEGQWRSEFRAGGLMVREPEIKDVEVGIDRVYGAHKRNEIIVFDDLKGYLGEKSTYSRKIDPAGEPTEDIEDKNKFHFMDAERYIVGWLKRLGQGGRPSVGGPSRAPANVIARPPAPRMPMPSGGPRRP